MPNRYNIYEETHEEWDSNTGEIKQSTKFRARKVPNGEKDRDYIRVYKYLNTVFAFKEIPLSTVPALIEISKYMTYASKGQQVVFHKSMREDICRTLGIKIDRLNQIVKTLKAHDVLRPTSDRGVYAVNPFIVACGSTLEINELRAQFDYDADTLCTYVDQTNLITGRTVHKAIQEVKKKKLNSQIPGQLNLFEGGEDNDDET